MSGDCGAISPAAWPSIGVFSIAQTLSANKASKSRCGEGRPRVKEQQSSYAPTSIQGEKGDPDMKNKVLVAGASGLIGVAAIEAFYQRAGRSSVFRDPSLTCRAGGTLTSSR